MAVGTADPAVRQAELVLVVAEGVGGEDRAPLAALATCVEELGRTGLEAKGVEGAQLVGGRLCSGEPTRRTIRRERFREVVGAFGGGKAAFDEAAVSEVEPDEKLDFRGGLHRVCSDRRASEIWSLLCLPPRDFQGK